MTNEPLNKADLEQLRNEGYTRDQIADYYDISLSKVKRLIKSFGIEKKTHPGVAKKAFIRPGMGQPLPDDFGLTVMEQAKRILGERLEETRLGYTLDGRLMNTPAILKEAGVEAKQI